MMAKRETRREGTENGVMSIKIRTATGDMEESRWQWIGKRGRRRQSPLGEMARHRGDIGSIGKGLTTESSHCDCMIRLLSEDWLL